MWPLSTITKIEKREKNSPIKTTQVLKEFYETNLAHLS